MRVFVALEISDPKALDAIGEVQRELVETGADLKTVERGNIHFTLKFLGEVSEAQAKKAAARLKKLELKGAALEVKGVGAFPRPADARIVWVGVGEPGRTSVTAFAAAVVGALAGIGETDSRPYTPHATVARIRSSRGVSRLAKVLREHADTPFGAFTAGELKLKSSVLSPVGPSYRDLGVYPLH
ncbi:MAG: RNA 2',3'-cyclic phosphodiesterase [archaeon]|nr:MAG: RNA 2',3'-cyclic phosphodiesterase [archaeon]